MSEWCRICCTRHGRDSRCPGDLLASEPERHSWRVTAQTPGGVEAYAVLLAPSDNLWRARILTYPNVLWLVPGGGATAKFVGASPQEAERQAIEFVEHHCRLRGYELCNATSLAEPGAIDPAAAGAAQTAPRKVRFLPLRFGISSPTEPGGTGNLSETGLFIITSLPLDPGTELRVMLASEVRCTDPLEATVRWMRRDPHVGRSPGMGVQLLQPPADYVRYVRGLN